MEMTVSPLITRALFKSGLAFRWLKRVLEAK